MKTFKVTCAALVLALSLSVPAYSDAGDGHTPGRPAPAPTATTMTATEASTIDDEISLVTFADVFWTLISIF